MANRTRSKDVSSSAKEAPRYRSSRSESAGEDELDCFEMSHSRRHANLCSQLPVSLLGSNVCAAAVSGPGGSPVQEKLSNHRRSQMEKRRSVWAPPSKHAVWLTTVAPSVLQTFTSRSRSGECHSLREPLLPHLDGVGCCGSSLAPTAAAASSPEMEDSNAQRLFFPTQVVFPLPLASGSDSLSSSG